MTSTTLDAVRQTLADLLSVKPSEIAPESSPESLEAWDSVQHLNLLLSLEEAFSIQFEPEEIEALNTVQAIAGAVDAKRALAQPR